MKQGLLRSSLFATLGLLAFAGNQMFAQAPTASTVPFVASSPTSPHTSWIGNPVTLKGTMTSPLLGTDTFTWDWDPGDGTAHCTGTITTAYTISGATNNPYVLACPHTYSTGSVGQTFTAVLNVTDTTNGKVAPPANCPPAIASGACYYTSINAPPPNLAVEVNNAIDNGLWYLHIHMNRHPAGNGADLGDWYGGVGGNADTSFAGGQGADAVHCVAFENSGFLQNNIPANPYSDDVRRCLNGVFDNLAQTTISPVSPYPTTQWATYSPDSNGNGIGIGFNGGSYPNYQTGMMLDAIAAAGTPTVNIPTGTALAASNPPGGTGGGGAYTYKDAIYDMVDEYSYCLNTGADGFSTSGGWHYTCQDYNGDNSISQWAAIGIIPARRKVGLPLGFDPLPPEVLALDQYWLTNSFTQSSAKSGYFGYTSASTLWGPYADTPSGLVQLAMSGLGRGTTVGGKNLWDNAETFLRDNFANLPTNEGEDADPGSIRGYYYGMLSFTKAMLLHDNNDGGFAAPGLNTIPITLLQSLDDPNTCALPVPEYKTSPGDSGPGTGTGACYPPIDWYGAQAAPRGTDPVDGVARLLVGEQNADGSWFGHNAVTNQYYLETGMAVTMLNKTVFQPVPVACFTANPTHVASGGPVTLNGQCSVDQNPANTLVTYEWDIDGTGGTNFTVTAGSPLCLTKSCSEINTTFTKPPAASLPYNYPVRLRVIDNAGLSADVIGDVVISAPPNPPNANAAGPYNFCPNVSATGALIYAPFILNGSNSTNPDQGLTDGTPGAPPSTIISYNWDLTGSCSNFTTSGVEVNATTAFDVPADFGTSFNVCLQVTNNDNLAFPTANLAAGLSSIASAQVTIHQPTDEACTHCVLTLTGAAKAPTPSVPGSIQLYWTDTNSTGFPIDHYNVYRSLCAPTGPVSGSCTSNFAPSIQLAGASSVTGTRGIPVPPVAGAMVNYVDSYQLVGGTTYYYRVAPATVNDTETCQGNVTLTVALSKGR